MSLALDEEEMAGKKEAPSTRVTLTCRQKETPMSGQPASDGQGRAGADKMWVEGQGRGQSTLVAGTQWGWFKVRRSQLCAGLWSIPDLSKYFTPYGAWSMHRVPDRTCS